MIANKLPQLMEHHGPFRARFFRIRFSSQIEELEEERIIATLYGCIIRRILKSPYSYGIRTPEEVKLTYNREKALILPLCQEDKSLFLEQIQEWNNALFNVELLMTSENQVAHINFLLSTPAMLLTAEGKVYQIKVKQSQVSKNSPPYFFFEILKIDGREWQNWGDLSFQVPLLDFASIPLKKAEKVEHSESNKDFQKLFQQQDEDEEDVSQEEPGGQTIKKVQTLFFDKKERVWLRYNRSNLTEGVRSVFNVQRSAKEAECDYAMWPLEIKIYFKGDEENETKIFPLLIQNLNETLESQEELTSKFCKMRLLLSEVIKESRVDAVKCEISLSRNGEKQRWNLYC